MIVTFFLGGGEVRKAHQRVKGQHFRLYEKSASYLEAVLMCMRYPTLPAEELFESDKVKQRKWD